MIISFTKYLKLFLFALSAIASMVIYSLSFDPNNDRVTFIYLAIFCTVFTIIFCESVADIWTINQYNKSKSLYPNHVFNILTVLQDSGSATGYLQAAIALLTTLTFFSQIIDNHILGTFVVILGFGSLALFFRKIHQIKLYMTPNKTLQ